MPGTLTHSPAEILKQLLIDLGLGNAHTSLVWPVFATQEPDLPDNCITVYDTLGTSQGRTMPDGEQQEKHSFQVRVRSTAHVPGHAKANAIGIALDQDVYYETVHVDNSTYTIQAITNRVPVITLGKVNPADRRSLFTINGVIIVRVA